MLPRIRPPFSCVSLHQTPNHMPRLDCPRVSAETSVSAETLNPKLFEYRSLSRRCYRTSLQCGPRPC